MVMSAENRALCYFYRHPPPHSGAQPVKQWTKIAQLVWNADGVTHPTPHAVRLCVLGWRKARKTRGRKVGWRKTTAVEDREILASFKKARMPLGTEVTSRDVQASLPRNLRNKICKRTIRNRLAERGYAPTKKVEKNDFLSKQRAVRVAFCRAHEHRTPAMWVNHLQGCGDLKDVTYYPRKMKARFSRYRCSWTYMRECEKYKTEFLKPKKQNMFTRKEHKSVKKCKILGFTAANGRVLCVRCLAPWNSSKFAVLVRKHVGPFFRRAFPERRLIRILIDSERLLHTDEAKRAFAEFGICPMAGWPKYSPDMNPQENVWSWTEKALRREEQKSDTFPTFCRKLLRVARRYPSPECLIPSMAKRVKRVLKHGGAMTKY